MYLILRIIPIVASFFSLAVLLFLHYQPQRVFGLFGLEQLTGWLILACLVISIVVLTGGLILIGAGHPFKARVRFLPFLLISWISGLALFLYARQDVEKWAVIVGLPILIWIWLESLCLFWQRTEAYQAYTLQRIARYLYIIAIFMFSIAMAGALVLLQVEFWIVAIVSVLVYWLIQYDYYCLHKLNIKESLILSLCGTILLSQLFFVLNLLPTHFLLHGITTAMFLYVWLGISKLILGREENFRLSVSLVVIGSLGFVAGFVTSFLV